MSEKKTISNPNNKIGIITLDEKQKRTNLPSYDVLLNRIDKIRDVAKEVNRNTLRNDIVESLKYDNILSIIGGRGAGKTSMLFTIYNELKEEERNIVLPIIMPELIEEHESIVSSILSAMRQNLDCIEKKIECCSDFNGSERCEYICKKYKLFERCTFNKKNKLRDQFEKLVSAFYSKENKNYGNDYSETEELMARSQDNSFNLINLFVGYWNSLHEVYSSYLECRNKKGEEPLVFIILDDTDLKPQVINELLFIIPKYLSHPNVVVIVSAAHKTLAYAVKNHMYKSMTGKHIDLVSFMNSEINYTRGNFNKDNYKIDLNEMRFGKEYHKICRLSEEVLRKLFPVYNRFYLRNYNSYENKKQFMMYENNEPNCDQSIPISQKIGTLLADFYTKIVLMHNSNLKSIRIKTIKTKNEPSLDTLKNKCEGFSLIDIKPDISVTDSIKIYKEQHPKPHLKTMYLSFFGKYSRDISAVYFSLEETIFELENKLDELYREKYSTLDKGIPNQFLEHICGILLKFTNSVIQSNRKLLMFSHCADELIKPQFLNWQLYVDYSKVLEVFQDSRYINENKKNCDAFVEMICLLNFIEQLIVLVMPQRKTYHGHEEFNKLMNLCKIGIIKHSEDINDLLNQYFTYHSFGIIPEFDINKITHQYNLIRALNNFNQDSNYHNDIVIHDRDWYELISEVFYRRFDPFARLSKYDEELFVFKYYKFVGREYLSFWNDYTQTIYRKMKEYTIYDHLETMGKGRMNNTIVDLPDIIMEKHWSMRNHIEELELSFDNISEIEAHAEKIGRILLFRSDNIEIKNALDTLMNSIRSEQPVKRFIIQIQFDDLSKLIRSSRRGVFELNEWFNQFEHFVERNVFLDKRRKDNKEFIEATSVLAESKNAYNQYIDYCLKNIINEIAIENRDLYSTFLNNNMRILRLFMQKLENREWYNFIEKERSFEKSKV